MHLGLNPNFIGSGEKGAGTGKGQGAQWLRCEGQELLLRAGRESPLSCDSGVS